MKKFIIQLKCLLALLLISFNLSAQEKQAIERYENAKIAINYRGDIGDLSQKLANALKIPFYSYQANTENSVNIQQNQNQTLKELLNTVNQQLSQDILRFDLINDQVTLVLLGKNSTLPTRNNFVGQVIFEEAPISNITIINEVETKAVPQPDLEQKDAVPAAKETAVPQAATQPIYSESELKERERAAQKIEAILEVSRDNNLIAQYSRRPQPVYVVSDEDKKKIDLDVIKSTKISTFLVFGSNVDLKDYKFDGLFQDFAKLDNVAVILHRQQRPPQRITITSPLGEKVNLNLSR